MSPTTISTQYTHRTSYNRRPFLLCNWNEHDHHHHNHKFSTPRWMSMRPFCCVQWNYESNIFYEWFSFNVSAHTINWPTFVAIYRSRFATISSRQIHGFSLVRVTCFVSSSTWNDYCLVHSSMSTSILVHTSYFCFVWMTTTTTTTTRLLLGWFGKSKRLSLTHIHSCAHKEWTYEWVAYFRLLSRSMLRLNNQFSLPKLTYQQQQQEKELFSYVI